MIFVLGNCEHAVPLDTTFPPSASGINQTIPTRRQISHARKLAKAKLALWRENIQPWSDWRPKWLA